MLLYASRARYVYECTLCKTPIGKGQIYHWGDPNPKARYVDNVPRQYVCCKCMYDRTIMKGFWAKWTKTKPDNSNQLALPLEEPRTAKFVTVTEEMLRRLELKPEDMYELSAEQFERFVADRMEAMGCMVIRVGQSNEGDGGVDIVFLTKGAFPVVGCAQVKHHRSARKKTGPDTIRELAGVIAMHKFQLGVVVTNTTFTPDATWAAEREKGMIRLRSGRDLKQWIKNDFLSDTLFRPIPREIELCPGKKLILPDYLG